MKKAYKKKGVGQATRDQSLLSPKMRQQEGVSRMQALRKSDPETSSPTVTVQPATTPSNPANSPIMGRDGSIVGTTNGSSNPQAPDQESVTRAVIRERIGKPPRGTEHDERPFASVAPPTDAAENPAPWTPNSSVKKNSRKKLADGFVRSNRLRRSFQ